LKIIFRQGLGGGWRKDEALDFLSSSFLPSLFLPTHDLLPPPNSPAMVNSATSFSIKGLGLKLDTAEHIQPHLDALKALGEGVEEIHLGGNTLGVEACKALAEVLPTLKSLKVRRYPS